MTKTTTHTLSVLLLGAGLAALTASAVGCSAGGGSQGAAPAASERAEPTGEAFATPEAAMLAAVDAAEAQDHARLEQIFTKDGVELLRSGDAIQDKEDVETVTKKVREKLEFADGPDGSKIAKIGEDGWPFAIPLVQTAAGWRFDVVTGAEEVDNRRVGRNELSTIATLHAFVDAQREYRAEKRDGRPQCFAQRVMSSEDRHDGLYWPTADGEPESPFGPLVADAASEGRTQKAEGAEPQPYHGYQFRLLKAQGGNAPGGARQYVDKDGLMTQGFAAIAWPAKYDSSGVMTFVVNQRGIVYQKDLGEETAKLAPAIAEYDPDASWDPVGDE
jgi:hypothetical protein